MGHIEQNPIAFIEKPPAGKREQVITFDEFKKILKLVSDDQLSDLLTVTWEMGSRPE